MATAPPTRTEREAAKPRFIRMRLLDQTLELSLNLPLPEKMAVRSATGIPFDAFVPSQDAKQFGEDSVAVLWWLARRANGEARLPWADVMNTWPALGEGDLEVEIVSDDGEDMDDPGKSAPV